MMKWQRRIHSWRRVPVRVHSRRAGRRVLGGSGGTRRRLSRVRRSGRDERVSFVMRINRLGNRLPGVQMCSDNLVDNEMVQPGSSSFSSRRRTRWWRHRRRSVTPRMSRVTSARRLPRRRHPSMPSAPTSRPPSRRRHAGHPRMTKSRSGRRATARTLTRARWSPGSAR